MKAHLATWGAALAVAGLVACPPGGLDAVTEAARVTSAREAFELVLPAAQEWSPDVALQSIEGRRVPWKGADAGRCYDWEFVFADSAAATASGEARVWLVSGSKVRDGGEAAAQEDVLISDEWIDSPEAMQSFRDNFGGSFMKRHPEAVVGIGLSRRADDLDPVWVVSADAFLAAVKGERSRSVECVVSINAADASVDTAPMVDLTDAGTDGVALLTAREAFDVAREEALAWREDTQLVSLAGIAVSASGQEGGCLLWSATFTSPTVGRNYSLRSLGDQVIDRAESKASAPAGISGQPAKPVRVKGEWPDSPRMLSRLQRLGEYADFVAVCPEYNLQFQLVGDAEATEGGYQWSVTLDTEGVTLMAVVARGG